MYPDFSDPYDDMNSEQALAEFDAYERDRAAGKTVEPPDSISGDLPAEIGDTPIVGNGGIVMRHDTTETITFSTVGGWIPIVPPVRLSAGWRMFAGGQRLDGIMCSQLSVYDEAGHRSALYQFNGDAFVPVEPLDQASAGDS